MSRAAGRPDVSLRFGRGVLMLAAAIIALFAPPPLLRFSGALVLALSLCALAYSVLAARSVHALREQTLLRSARLSAFPLRLTITSGLPFVLPRIVVSDATGRLHVDHFHRVITLPPSGERTIETTARGLTRGVYPLGPVTLRGCDPLGLFPWEKREEAAGSVVVYPSILPIELLNDRGLPAGTLRAVDPIYEDVTRFRSLREYSVGDEPKRVNWKASAKAAKLLTTEYDRTLSFPVRILLNLMREDYPERRRDALMERSIETAASVVFEFTRIGMAVGLVVMGGSSSDARALPERAGWEHADLLLETLARAEFSEGTADFMTAARGRSGFAASSAGPAGLRIIVIGPQPTPVQVTQLKALKGGGRSVELLKVLPDSEADAHLELASLLRVVRITEFGERLRGN